MGACQQALADNPRYSMAMLLREALDGGAPPSMARLPMTPEEVAAAYDERFFAATAIGRIRFWSSSGLPDAAVVKMSGTSPEATSTIAAPAPL